MWKLGKRVGGAAAVAFLMCGPLPAQAQIGRRQSVVDPNVATKAELMALPGISEAIVATILEQRPFASMLALDAGLQEPLSGEQRAMLYEMMFIHIDLNAASREEILLVPGVGKKIAHEFEEYRPYNGLAPFRREIGKYVDEKEVARLEQYVYVRLDLNTARDEDLLAIPGLGKRMLLEFKEYRPYKSLEQFRREIGKYVDDKEVARLERYVTIR